MKHAYIQRLVARSDRRIHGREIPDRFAGVYVVNLKWYEGIGARVAHVMEPAFGRAFGRSVLAAHEIEGQLTGAWHTHIFTRIKCALHVFICHVNVNAGDVFRSCLKQICSHFIKSQFK